MLCSRLQNIFGAVKATAGILLLAFCSSAIMQTVVVVDYFFHQDYYANVLCINKEKAEISCNGKCQLTKSFNQEDGNNAEPTEPSATPKTLKIYGIAHSLVGFFSCVDCSVKRLGFTSELPASDFLNQVFVPPELRMNRFSNWLLAN